MGQDEFMESLRRMVRRHELNKLEGYVCGNCAAFPCYRGYPADNPAGQCFQNVRLCRQECRNYDYNEFPARGGVCRLDNQKVSYEQGCHVESVKKSRL